MREPPRTTSLQVPTWPPRPLRAQPPQSLDGIGDGGIIHHQIDRYTCASHFDRGPGRMGGSREAPVAQGPRLPQGRVKPLQLHLFRASGRHLTSRTARSTGPGPGRPRESRGPTQAPGIGTPRVHHGTRSHPMAAPLGTTCLAAGNRIQLYRPAVNKAQSRARRTQAKSGPAHNAITTLRSPAANPALRSLDLSAATQTFPETVRGPQPC